MTPILFVIVAADYIISKNYKESHEVPGEIEVWNDIYNNNINAEVAIYGSSRAWVHISPKIFKNTLGLETYNFGIDGHNFWLQYLRHKEYINYNTAPEYIILSVDIFSLQKRADLYELNQFLPFMLWNGNIKKYTNSYKGFSWKDYYLPLLRYYGNIRNIANSIKLEGKNASPIKYRKNGYKGVEREWNDDLSKAKKERQTYNAKLDSNSVKLFEHFLSATEEDNIEVILVYTPEFIDGQNYVKNRKDIIKLYEYYSKKYNIPFMDYSNNPICTKKEYFYNASRGCKLNSV